MAIRSVGAWGIRRTTPVGAAPVLALGIAVAFSAVRPPGVVAQRAPDVAAQTAERPAVPASALEVMEWRLIGPFRGGKSIAVVGHPTQKAVFYMGVTTGSGVWRTDDAGTTWHNVSDGYFTTTTVSAIAISQSDPDVLYAGTGDVSFRTNVSRGDGVYRTDDGGRTWRNVGLAETRNIARIAVHPTNPDVVYVASQGHHFVPDPHRGVYRSRDGGDTWEQVFFIDEDHGVITMVMDPNDPDVVYVGTWAGRRFPWTIRDVGEHNGIWKTSDGGDVWEEVTDNPGLPTGLKGRISLDVSRSQPGRVWALMTAEGDGSSGLYQADAPGQADWLPCRDYYCSGNGLYRSDDGGATWELVRDDPNFFQRPWYYTHVTADPTDAETVYVHNTSLWKSTDGGATFGRIPLPHGDTHELWIDPTDARRMIDGNDGGATVTLNGGRTWSSVENQPTSQMYNASVDDAYPYNVCAPQQDNSSICVPSRSDYGFIGPSEWRTTGAGENGGIAVDPRRTDLSYGGDHHWMSVLDRESGQRRWISPWAENYYGHGEHDLRYRWVWDFKVLLSPHDPDVLYTASQVVHRSTDGGVSWEDISRDLTRADTTKFEHTPPSDRGEYWGLTRENVGIEWYAAITTLAESRVRQGVIWTGSNDGLVHVTTDGGATWTDVTPPSIVEDTWISAVEPSPHDPGVAFVTANRHMLGDDRPYAFRTADYGRTWESISEGLRADDFLWVIREDDERPGLLYAGAEWGGVYVSFDRGDSWQSLRLNLPVVPVRDLKVKEGDLVAATHGRSFWILDGIEPVRQLMDDPRVAEVRLFQPRPTVRFRQNERAAFRPVQSEYTAEAANPEQGVVIRYHLASQPPGEVRLEIHDGAGNEIRTFSSRGTAPEPGPDLIDPADLIEPGAPASAGANVFVWDMRYPEPIDWVPKTLYRHRDPLGPLAPPGRYAVELTVGGRTYRQTFEIVKDPRVESLQADFDAQFAFLMAIRDKIGEDHLAVQEIHEVRRRIVQAVERAQGRSVESRIGEAAKALDEQLWAIEDQLRQFRPSLEHRAKQELINWPVRIDDKYAKLMEHVETADYAPTARDRELFEDLSRRLSVQIEALAELMRTDVAEFDRLVRELVVAP